MGLEYFTSERFIHDDLLQKAENVIAEVKKDALENRGRGTYVMVWPREKVRADDGTFIDRAIVMEIEPSQDKLKAVRALVDRAKGYALLLIEQKQGVVVATFESTHGARYWHMPIERHGDIDVFGTTVVRDDQEHLGVLWSSRQGTA